MDKIESILHTLAVVTCAGRLQNRNQNSEIPLKQECDKWKKYDVNSAFFFDEVQSFVINTNRYLVAIS